MKCIGMIGGTSWESTAHYYELLNQGVKERRGGLHSAKTLMWSVDFAEIEALQNTGAWDECGEIYADIARRLEQAGADCIVIAANTMHIVADAVKQAVSIPLLHMGDAIVRAAETTHNFKLLLLGTRYTTEEPFLRNFLSYRGLDIVVPDKQDIAEINRIIYEELCLGAVTESSRKKLLDVITRNKCHSIDGVILGCTELGMILQQNHVDLPLFDTTLLHVQFALDFSLDH